MLMSRSARCKGAIHFRDRDLAARLLTLGLLLELHAYVPFANVLQRGCAAPTSTKRRA